MVEKIIKERLDGIEQRYGVRILYACESGSRAWNFASKDSDYDVRFVYVRPLSWYLGISDKRDVIEEPILDEFDINGWDLQKFLKLAFKSNVVVFEWLKSPIIYRKSELWDEISTLCFEYFSVKASLYHYLNMAERNYRLYLAPPHIKLKKFFYVLRPLLFFFYIQTHQKPSPMDFLELLDFARAKNFISAQIDEQIQILYAMKIQSTELTKTNQSTLAQTDGNALKQDILLKWINQNFDKCKGLMKNLTANTPKRDIAPLDKACYNIIYKLENV